MRVYPVPVEMSGEEKIIGGHLTLRQLVYLILGASLGGLTAWGASFLPLFVRFVPVAAGLALAVALGFAERHGMGLDVYIWRWLVWKTRKREFYLRGDE